MTRGTLFLFVLFLLGLVSAGPIRAAEGITPEGKPQHRRGQKVGRGLITHKLESAPGGAYLTVEVIQDRVRSAVKLILALDGGAHSPQAPNWILTPGSSNPSGYVTRFQFHLDYEKLRALAKQGGVQNADTRIAPGQPMVVCAHFPSGHRWGGSDRSGRFILPSPSPERARVRVRKDPVPAATADLPAFGEGPPATALDVGQPIDEALAEQFAPLDGRGGLEVGGQIRSRVEAEGKFQLDKAEFERIRTSLFDIANDRARAREILGPDWTLTVVNRYMKRHRNGRLVIDADGFPVPDPMIDTYYDTPNLDAAKNDIAIRYRWTAGNDTGTWNFKPGIGRRSPDGIVYRVEYGVDAVDDRPESIEPFANSEHPLNPFQLLRQKVPGVRPSQFFQPAIRLTDDRYKFALTHRTGVIIEVSLDRVHAERLNKEGQPKVTFYQLEMDVEHIATEVQATAPEPTTSGDGPVSPYATMHSPRDVREGSPTLESQAVTFQLSTEVIKRLRDGVIGEKWRPGAQKYAFAAAALGAIRRTSASASVRALGFHRGKCSSLLEETR